MKDIAQSALVILILFIAAPYILLLFIAGVIGIIVADLVIKPIYWIANKEYSDIKVLTFIDKVFVQVPFKVLNLLIKKCTGR